MQISMKILHRAHLITVIVIMSMGSLFAQESGKITGLVTDKQTGEALPAASAFIDSLNIGAIADLNGSYTLLRVPAGTHVVQVSFIGYAPVEKTIVIEAGGEVVVDAALEFESQGLAEVTITAQRQGQLAAINQQLMADQMKNVVSADRIQEIPDANAAESLSRLPGISLSRSSGEGRGVIIRGLAPQYNSVQINGISMASTGFVGGGSRVSVSQDRGSDLSGISSENLGGIEVFKAITPDMDAGAIGGVVNLQLAKAKVEPEYTARLYGSYNAMHHDFAQYKGFIKASRRFFNNSLGIQASFNAERRNRGRDRLTAQYFGKEGENENEKVWQITQAAIEDRLETRKRMGGSLIFDWEKNGQSIMFSNFLNTTSQHIEYRMHNYVDGSETFVIPGLRDQDLNMISNALKGKHNLLGMILDWNLVHSLSRTEVPFTHEMKFYEQAGLGDADRLMNPEEFLALLPVDTVNMALRQAESDQMDMQERRLVGDLNLTVPFRIGSGFSGMFKAGGKVTQIDRSSDQNTGLLVAAGLPDDPLLDPQNWLTDDYDPGKVLNGKTDLGAIMDPTHGYTLYERLESYYQVSPFYGPNNDYSGTENIYAAYGMLKLNFGSWLTLIPGIRYEKDNNIYSGYYRMTTSGWGSPGGELSKNSEDFDDDYFFPMFHVKIKPLKWLDLRMAYTNTISRPSFHWRIPYMNRSLNSPDWSAGIPSLGPALSENLDAYLSVYDSKFGLFTIGVFRKNIDNVSYRVDWKLTEEGEAAELGLYRETYGVGEEFEFTSGLGTIPVNLTETTLINGVEVELQTNMFFLPGLLKNFVLNTNFTYIQSESQLFSSERVLDEVTWQQTTVTGLRPGPMPQQPNYIFNVTLGYDIGGFSGRASLFSQGRTLNGVGKLAPYDTYIDPFTRVDFSLRYSVNDHLTFLFNGTNILNEPDAHFQSDTPKYRLLEYYGSMWDFGIQYKF